MSNLTDVVFIDLSQAEALYSISKRTLWTWISENRLSAYQPLKKTLIRRSELEALIEKARVGADLDGLVNQVVSEVLR
jgi:excisionase family DNA binding protein